jgi:restriction endonuclease S subunit
MRDGWVEATLRDALEPIANRPDGKDYPLVLSVTEKRGIIPQTEIFKHRIATDDISKYKVLEPMDIAYNPYLLWCGAIGQWQGSEAGVVSPVYECFRVKSNCEPRYLGYIFETGILTSYFDALAIGSIVRRRRTIPSDFIAAPIQLPPLPDQKRIVDLISSVDSYIEALQQQLKSAKRSRNAVLHELLTAGGDDWVETTLGEICTEGLFADGDWVESKDQDPEGEYRLLQLADIGDGTFLNKSDRWMNREQFNRLGCTKLEVNDVLIARMPDPIGRACLFPEGLPVCATVVDVAIVRTGNETLQKFLALLINSSDFRTEAFSLLTGTTRQRISRGNLAKISFVIPSQIKQLEIVNLISLFDGEIAQSVRVIEEAKLLRSGLLSDLLSGEHEIPVTYDKVMGAA